MMIAGLTDAYKVFDDVRFYKAAMHTMRFLENELMEGTTLYRSFKNKRSHVRAFLDDYAYVIQAQIRLYQVTFDEYWITRAELFTEHVWQHFSDPNDIFFYYSAEAGELIARKKELFDNVIPASNSVMAMNLLELGKLLEREDWLSRARAMTDALTHIIRSEPYFMSNWAIAYTALKRGLAEVAMAGEDVESLRAEFHKQYYPFALVLGTKTKSRLPLLEGKEPKGKGTLYVCFEKTCSLPVYTVTAATDELKTIGFS
jgi:uncharacterized protein